MTMAKSSGRSIRYSLSNSCTIVAIILLLLSTISANAFVSAIDISQQHSSADIDQQQDNINEFHQLQCFNGGTLRNGKCFCTERFEGEQCEIEPCLNDGVKSVDSTCHCPWGTTGDRCEKVTYCIESNGRLEDGKCICADRFSGLFCQIRLCHNGDFVRKGSNGYCKCDKGYTGPFCSEKLVCQHGHVNDDNKCACDANWTGERCERCAIDPRLVGSDCKIVINEELLVAPQRESNDVLDMWSIAMIVSGIAVAVALIVVISAVLLKRRQTKTTKIDSTLGTDV